MEDGSDGQSEISTALNNGEVSSIMANFPEIEVTNTQDTKTEVISAVKVNGDTHFEPNNSEEVDSSDCDALIIDERPQTNNKKRKLATKLKAGFKGFKKLKTKQDIEPPSNPYFSESLFELSELHNKSSVKTENVDDVNKVEEKLVGDSQSNENGAVNEESVTSNKPHPKRNAVKKTKKQNNPKLREYAQYLGLQPTVSFKCSKCGQSGFESLSLLNDHHSQCSAQGPIVPPMPSNQSSAPSTNFRVTRKVFLCSACGTYYENWNLFLHMREVHKRCICLYCLGMFSQPEKLSLHLITKHNCVPNHFNSPEDFFELHKDSCFLMCCDCEKVFSERDNFFNHNCLGKHLKAGLDQAKTKTSATNNKNLLNVKQMNKSAKQVKNKSFVEHVTGDTPAASSADLPQDTSQQDTVVEEEMGESTSSNQEKNQEDVEQQLSDAVVPKTEENTTDTNTIIEHEAAELTLKDSEVDINPEISKETDIPIKLEEENDFFDFGQAESEKPCDNTENNTFSCEETKSPQSVTENTNLAEQEEEHNQTDTNPDFDTSFLSNDNADESEPEENLKDSGDTESGYDILEENSQENTQDESLDSVVEEETRRVPKVTLKLPKSISSYSNLDQEDSNDSEKLMMEIDQIESETELNMSEHVSSAKEVEKDSYGIMDSSMGVAGIDIPVVELQLEQPLDKFDIRVLLQTCLNATVPVCVYCNHARKIAVNGKQLALHAISEHRFSAIVNSITAEELIPESFVTRIKEGLAELENVYFNLESATQEDALFAHVFECFQCRYATTIHKELYLHNRKMHAKTILLCIMCKSNFYSYSELICHLCPGIYALNNDVSFRCCMCVGDDLPSAFRLMVHLRKRHHACDVCLDLCNNQSRLSNHVWKHKLHHLCYRCGIAYRNKPDITKHLFWKHGTESVVCKKCLQKKWPHVYHFCIPPSSFTCEECNLVFTRAVSLKVHKRLHSNERPHICSFENCKESFISNKLLLKHEFKHREPPEEILDKSTQPDPQKSETVQNSTPDAVVKEDEKSVNADVNGEDNVEEKPKPKPKVDVYDLPELNLSESDSSDSDEDSTEKICVKSEPIGDQNLTASPVVDSSVVEVEEAVNIVDTLVKSEELPKNVESEPAEPAMVLDNIWDDFKNYQASKEKLTGNEYDATLVSEPVPIGFKVPDVIVSKITLETIMRDHDYCLGTSDSNKQEVTSTEKLQSIERTRSMDHDYCYNTETSGSIPKPPEMPKPPTPVPPQKQKKNSSSSDLSSDSDSSSCTCGSNCSCSSSSDSSSSTTDSSDSDSSTSEGRRRQQARRDRRRERAKNKNKESENSAVDVVATDNQHHATSETPIQESDLDTTETETDEDFYDKQPQKLANKLLAEKRNQLMMLAGIGPLINGSVLESSRPSTPSLPEVEEVKPKKKSKNKKRKKKSKRQEEAPHTSHTSVISSSKYQYYHQPTVAPITLSLPRNSPLTVPPFTPSVIHEQTIPSTPGNSADMDSSLRASKRRRVPNKFYGYSSDEEHDKPHLPPVLKWRKADLPSPARPVSNSPLLVPPITIRATPPATPTIEPITIRPTVPPGEVRLSRPRPQLYVRPTVPPHIAKPPHAQDQDSGSDSNDSTSDDDKIPTKPNQPPLYCYCRCPYDEVSEMIGCDADDCDIEWFHFECVGIMVPPKGQWFCPDCRKKKQMRKELLHT